MLHGINISEEMSKKDIIITILYILEKILEYTSKLDQTIPSIFDKKEKEVQSKNVSDMSTCPSDSNEENDTKTEEPAKEKKYTLEEYICYWSEKMNFGENMLFLMMMNLDKILNSKKVILNDKNIENILFTCMVLTQKFYEDEIFSDKDYSSLKKIECEELALMQVTFLDYINYSLYIKDEELDGYKTRMRKVWEKNMLYLLKS